jgi:endo-1,4-beta-xylanase
MASGSRVGRVRQLGSVVSVLVLVGLVSACGNGGSTPPNVPPSDRPQPTTAPTAAATPAPAATAAPTTTPTAAATQGPTLRDLAGSRYFGSAFGTQPLDSDPAYAKLAAEQFSQATPENAMKWGLVEPQRGLFDWGGADALVAFAQAHGQKVRGHTLLWHNQMPGWLSGGNWKAADLKAVIAGHIVTEVGRYRGKIYAWDVVNEPFNDDGTWRSTLFYDTLGKGYIADAFKSAHAADPQAKLYLNDYNVEGINPKSDALYELAKSLKQAGVPIDGVGFQGHFDLQYPFPNDFADNLRRFADLGLEVAVTELDVRMETPATPDKLAAQADYYRQTVQACLAVQACVGITVWGFADTYSWVPYTFPGQGAADLWDDNFGPKPALAAVQQALAGK